MERNEAVTRAVDESRDEILAFLARLVERNSYTHDKSGVDAVAEMVAAEMPAGFEHETIPNEQYGNHHRFLLVQKSGLPIVLAGHLDTLCPPDKSFNCMTEQGEKLIGPGVNDMKGGDTVLIWALKILERCGLLDDLSVVCIFNGDEEVGSPTSRSIFQGMKGKASRAFVFEGGGVGGTVVTTRKGVVRYRLSIQGKPAHFGCMKERKISALLEAAHKVLSLEGLNEPDGSLVANVGRIEGGLAANKVAESASLDFEARYWTPEVEQRALKAVEDIVAAADVPGCELNLAELSYRPPLQPSEESMQLFHHIQDLAGALGQSVSEEKRGGVSDANWLAHAGVPTLDGLGPIGDLDFTPEEYILKDTLFQRVELTAHLLASLANQSGDASS